VKNQTTELCEMAIIQYVYTLEHVKDQTIELCEMAVRKDKDVSIYIRDTDIQIYYYEYLLASLTITLKKNNIKSSCDEKMADVETCEFICKFVVQPYRSTDLFELNVESIDLSKINKLFLIDPAIIYDIVKEKPKTILTKKNDGKEYMVIEYVINILGRKIPLEFNITKREYLNGSDDEITDLRKRLIRCQQDIVTTENNERIFRDEMIYHYNKNIDLEDIVKNLEKDNNILRQEIARMKDENQKRPPSVLREDYEKLRKKYNDLIPRYNKLVKAPSGKDLLEFLEKNCSK
jgi:hypothetical protein